MQAGAVHMRVGLEVWDECDLSKARDALRQLQYIPSRLEARVQRLDSVKCQLARDRIVVHVPAYCLPRFFIRFTFLDRESILLRACKIAIEKVINHHSPAFLKNRCKICLR